MDVIIPVIVAIIMSIPGIYAAYAGIKKDSATKDTEDDKIALDFNKAVQDAALEIINPLREENKRLWKKISVLDNENKVKDKRIDELESRLEGFEGEVKDKKERIVELEAMLKEKDAQIAALQVEVEDLQNRLGKVESRSPKTTPLKKQAN